MCEVIGILSKNKLSPLWFESFRENARSGKDGHFLRRGQEESWGIAGYLGNWAVHFGAGGKEKSGKAYREAYEHAMLSKSGILIANFKRTKESEQHILSPRIYGNWIYANTGRIVRKDAVKEAGDEFFKCLIERLEHKSPRNYAECITVSVEEVREQHAIDSLSFLLSDGNHLVGYRDPSCGAENHELFCTQAKDVCILCTSQLPGFEWKPFHGGSVMVVHRGGELYEF